MNGSVRFSFMVQSIIFNAYSSCHISYMFCPVIVPVVNSEWNTFIGWFSNWVNTGQPNLRAEGALRVM